VSATEKPVFRFRDDFDPESYWSDEYVRAGLPVLESYGWLARPATPDDEAAAVAVLDGLDGLSLDLTDVFPFGLLWALRARGVLIDVAGLDRQLTDWRQWEETDHVGEPLDFLPDLIPA
jgi:hypothetical protein